MFSAACLLLVGERCRQFSRNRKCPLHDALNVDKLDVENDDSAKKENGIQSATRKTSEEMYRTYFGKFDHDCFTANLLLLKIIFTYNFTN